MSLTLLATEILEAAKIVDASLDSFTAPSPGPSSKSTKPATKNKISPKCHRIFHKLRLCFFNRTRKSPVIPHTEKQNIFKTSRTSSRSSNNYTELSKLEKYDQLPEDLHSQREDLINKCNEIRSLVETPETALVNIYCNWTQLVSLQVICHFRLFDAIPTLGSATYSEIAAKSGIPRDLAIRFIRASIPNGIFSEPVPGIVHHTPRSRWLLTRGPGLLDLIALNCYELAPAGLRYPEAIEKFNDIQEPEHSPFAIANDNLPIFQVFARDEKRRLRFGRSMQYLTSADSYDIRHILNGYDWASVDLPGARVLDVGGGMGHISALIAAHTTHLQFTVQDLPPVVEDAISNRSTLAAPHILERISFLPLSFFTPHLSSTPAFDVVFLRWILHNWSDKYTRQIFRAMIPGLRNGSKVFIIEYVLPEKGYGLNASDSFGLCCDMMMGVGFGAKERTAESIHYLMDDVARELDGRWINWDVKQLKNSTMSFIEAVWEGP